MLDPVQQFSGAIAQLGERIVRNDEVAGSRPASSTKTSYFSDTGQTSACIGRGASAWPNGSSSRLGSDIQIGHGGVQVCDHLGIGLDQCGQFRHMAIAAADAPFAGMFTSETALFASRWQMSFQSPKRTIELRGLTTEPRRPQGLEAHLHDQREALEFPLKSVRRTAGAAYAARRL